jgi:predicted ATP-grasp superfamily ATP-dependent carboligase
MGRRLPALILGSHIAALGVLRTLRRRDISSQVLDATSDIIIRSRWYRPAARTLAETPDPDVLAAHLRSLPLAGAVLIACSDVWTQAVAGLPDDVRGRFRASVPPPAAVAKFVDKAAFAGLVAELDISRPRTTIVRSVADLADVPDEDLRAGFLKPIDSGLYHRHYGTKGAFVASRAEAEAAVEEAASHGITFLLQEWIPGNMSSTILLDGFVDREGRVAAMLARRRVRMDPPRISNTTVDVTIPLADAGDAPSEARRLLAAVDYRGIFNVEFKFDSRDGRFKIIELNPRPFWLIAHIATAGVDLPWLAWLDAQDLPVPTVDGYEVGRYGMYEVPEIAALARAWLARHRPEGPVIAPWLRGDHTLLWAADPLPGVFDLARAVRRRASRLLPWTARPERVPGA